MRQYKAKIKEWGLEKNFRNEDMQAIVRKDSKRKSENSHKATRFRCRKRPVPQHRIERYRRDHASSDETIMGDACKLTGSRCDRAVRLTFANLATPSDISCETLRSTCSSDHTNPVQQSAKPLSYAMRHHLAMYCGITSSFPRSAAWTSFASDDFVAHSLLGPTPYATKLINERVALSSRPDDPDSPLVGCFATMTYRGLLQPLISKLQVDDLLCAIVNLASENGIACYRPTTVAVPWCPAVASNVKTAGWPREGWNQWPAYRLKIIYVQAMAGTASIRALVAKIEAFTKEVCIPETGLPFPVLASTIYPFLSHAEVGGLIASFGHILRSSDCRCDILEKLPSILLFETFLETYRQCALGVAGMSNLDHHHRFNVVGERIKTWLQGPLTIIELHRGYDLAVVGMPRVIIPPTADEAPLEGTEVALQG